MPFSLYTRFFYTFFFETKRAIMVKNKQNLKAHLLLLLPLQLCPTLCDPINGSPPGSTIPGVLQARTLEWVAISFSNA